MADAQFSALSRARTGIPIAGVIHISTRQNADFTVLANALAQRPGSAITLGVAAYIASLPDGAPVSISALCEHFSEGEILISRALRELEEAGYLERRRERGPDGRIRTRTFFYDVPPGKGAGPAPDPGPGPDPDPDPEPDPPAPRRRRRQRSRPQAAPKQSTTAPRPAPAAAPEGPAVPPPPSPPSASLSEADPRAVAVLAALRGVDARLVLSGTETARLAPAVTRWLAAGVTPAHLTELLTTALPVRLVARPARILAFRLSETPPPTPVPVPTPAKPVVLPFQTCDGCDRAFRAAAPGLCRDCRTEHAEHAEGTAPETLRAAC
ncbi:hypothetical protein [Streptomyces carminius]|uniref:hypothetical protein n=1 Tax=Streptomyces carminius TaxID=2665496 RepID=UPI001303FC69|nr:hypothetical protein [Streptomyces carminius]